MDDKAHIDHFNCRGGFELFYSFAMQTATGKVIRFRRKPPILYYFWYTGIELCAN